MNFRQTRAIMLPVLILVGIGVLMVYSSTAVTSLRKYNNGFHYLWNHLFTVGVGFTAMMVLSRIDYRKIRPFIYVLLAGAFLLLLLVFVPGIGVSANGARRWLRLWPTTFQPSELVKIILVFFFASYMEKNIRNMRDIRYGILIPMTVMLAFQAVIIIQPDFGAVMSLAVLTIGLLILGGARLSYLGMLLLSALPVLYILVSTSSYRMKRVTCFIDPWKDAYGCGFQLVQSFIAFGNGGIFGVGLGESRQKLYYLPEVHTDFIFSLIGEELGLLGVVLVLGVFLSLFIMGFRIARQTRDAFSYYLSYGLTLMIGVQAIVNFAVSTGMMPTKGLPLPFISYGGSSLLVNMAAAGILMSIANKNQSVEDDLHSLAGRYPLNDYTRRRVR